MKFSYSNQILGQIILFHLFAWVREPFSYESKHMSYAHIFHEDICHCFTVFINVIVAFTREAIGTLYKQLNFDVAV